MKHIIELSSRLSLAACGLDVRDSTAPGSPESALSDPNAANKTDPDPSIVGGSVHPTAYVPANQYQTQTQYSLWPSASLKPTDHAPYVLRRL
jgi:hypothetical protein